MRLFLHAGTEKTGSSHIQTLCVNGRKHLESGGIWFPDGIPRHEKRMRAGLVSAGNAFVISERARDGDHTSVRAELARHRDTAQSRGCAAVFLSSELLLPYCSAPGTWQRLFADCRQAGFDSLSVLLVLRDPVNQLISLFKHRSRGGTAGDIESWVTEGYRLPYDLHRLREQVDDANVALVARGYSRGSGALERLFFDDWLDVPSPEVDLPAMVNPSLTLSELALMRRMAERRPELVAPLYDALVAVPALDKVQGRGLEAHARCVAARAVASHAEEWAAWNALLPESERLVVPQAEGEIPVEPREIAFSKEQMDALMGFLAESVQPRFLARFLWTARIRPALGWVKRAVMPRRRS